MLRLRHAPDGHLFHNIELFTEQELKTSPISPFLQYPGQLRGRSQCAPGRARHIAHPVVCPPPRWRLVRPYANGQCRNSGFADPCIATLGKRGRGRFDDRNESVRAGPLVLHVITVGRGEPDPGLADFRAGLGARYRGSRLHGCRRGRGNAALHPSREPGGHASSPRHSRSRGRRDDGLPTSLQVYFNLKSIG